MTRLVFLSSTEKRKFDSPPIFTKEQRPPCLTANIPIFSSNMFWVEPTRIEWPLNTHTACAELLFRYASNQPLLQALYT